MTRQYLFILFPTKQLDRKAHWATLLRLCRDPTMHRRPPRNWTTWWHRFQTSRWEKCCVKIKWILFRGRRGLIDQIFEVNRTTYKSQCDEAKLIFSQISPSIKSEVTFLSATNFTLMASQFFHLSSRLGTWTKTWHVKCFYSCCSPFVSQSVSNRNPNVSDYVSKCQWNPFD